MQVQSFTPESPPPGFKTYIIIHYDICKVIPIIKNMFSRTSPDLQVKHDCGFSPNSLILLHISHVGNLRITRTFLKRQWHYPSPGKTPTHSIRAEAQKYTWLLSYQVIHSWGILPRSPKLKCSGTRLTSTPFPHYTSAVSGDLNAWYLINARDGSFLIHLCHDSMFSDS